MKRFGKHFFTGRFANALQKGELMHDGEPDDDQPRMFSTEI